MQTQNLAVYPIPAFTDNYIWCIAQVKQEAQSTTCVIVDPGDGIAVLDELSNRQMDLAAILVTHHHADHIGGIKTLKQHYPDAEVYAADTSRIPCVSHVVNEDTVVSLPALDLTFKVMDVPGHTRDHIAFYNDDWLFCGDTLFSAGCGRLFEGSPQQMHASLQKIMQLPDATLVFCAHEYTLANIEFAKAVEPNNQTLVEFSDWAHQQRAQGKPTLPSKIAIERQINPFVRCDQREVRESAASRSEVNPSSDCEVFSEIRRWKDQF